MKKALLVGVAIAAALLAACSNIERSRNLADPRVPPATLAQQVCSNCHGVGGNAVSPNFPNLAGQIEPYVVAQLNGFKSHGRRDPAGFEYMWGLSRSLSEEQINGLAGYFAAQTPIPQPIEGDRSRLDAGKSIFENGVADKGIPACAGCHGPKGEGNPPFPRIAGQHVDYIVKQLLVFQRTDERPQGAIMKTVAHELTEQHIRDVATYVQAMPSL
jgi:cytochrome c553